MLDMLNDVLLAMPIFAYLLVEQSSSEILYIFIEQLSASDHLTQIGQRPVYRLDQLDSVVALQQDEGHDRGLVAGLLGWGSYLHLDQLYTL